MAGRWSRRGANLVASALLLLLGLAQAAATGGGSRIRARSLLQASSIDELSLDNIAGKWEGSYVVFESVPADDPDGDIVCLSKNCRSQFSEATFKLNISDDGELEYEDKITAEKPKDPSACEEDGMRSGRVEVIETVKGTIKKIKNGRLKVTAATENVTRNGEEIFGFTDAKRFDLCFGFQVYQEADIVKATFEIVVNFEGTAEEASEGIADGLLFAVCPKEYFEDNSCSITSSDAKNFVVKSALRVKLTCIEGKCKDAAN